MPPKFWFCFFAWFLLFACSLRAQLPEGFYEQVYASGFDQPMGISFDAQGRMFVWEKAGRVFIVDSDGRRLSEPLIDIREEVSNWKDHGLMGFALDPDFTINGYFYLFYALDLHYYEHYGRATYNADTTINFQATIGRLTRFTADPAGDFTRALPNSRKVLLGEKLENGVPLLYEFHGLGSVLAAEDGSLLLSCGDATSNHGADIGGDSLGTFVSQALERGIITPDQDLGSYKAQYLGSYSGKILRIDAETGDGLPSNPFFDPARPRSPQSRIWATGFRNPYRISLWPNSGAHFAEEGRPGVIFAGDVGNGSYEELNLITEGGQNFGWPVWEGVGWSTGFIMVPVPANPMAKNPLYGLGNCSKEYFNFRDLLFHPKPGGLTKFSNPCDTSKIIPSSFYPRQANLPVLAWSNARWNPPTRALLMAPDEKGEQYRTLAIEDPDSPVEGESFDGYSSLAGVVYDAKKFPENYRGKYFAFDYSGWIKVMEFDDDYRLQSVEAFYDEAKNIHHLALNPKDGALYFLNLTDEVRKIDYGGNPPPVAVIQADRFYGSGPLSVQFDASDSYDNDQAIVAYEWDFGDGTKASGLRVSHTFQTSGNQVKSFTVRLTVRDSLGADHTAARIVSLNNSPPQVKITSFKDGDRYDLNQTALLILDAEVKDAEHKQEDLSYEWRVFFHHNDHFHPDPVNYDSKTFTLISPVGCEDEIYWYRIELSVTDPGGLTTKDRGEVFPYCDADFINFIDLDAKRTENTIGLEWRTQLEKEVAVFEIQRTTDFFDFQTIGSIPAGKPDASYQFEDTNPREGNNIYRIKARTFDQTYTYSPFVTGVFLATDNLWIFPNPAGDFFTLQIQSASGGPVYLELFTLSGRRLLRTSWETQPKTAFRQNVITQTLNNGAYFYRLINGEDQKVGKIIISK